MDLYDWLLFLHVLSAFIVVGALTALWALVLGRRAAMPDVDTGSATRFVRLGGILAGAGMVGTLVFGIWLAIDLDGYELWDGWILASLILWVVGGWAGDKSARELARDPVAGRRAGIRFQALYSATVLAILALMIWKPGGMSVLDALRSDSVNLPLFLHVLGAMLLVGALFAVGLATVLAWRRPEHASGPTRFGLRTLLYGVLPAYVVMRVGAQWTEAEQDFPEGFEPAWLDIGYITADAGAVLVLVSIVLSAIGLRKLRAGRGGVRVGRIVGVISLLLLAAFLVAVWAMTAKPM